jgi:hypothetical protein
VVVTVTVPEEPENSVPMTPAEAEGANVAEASTARLKNPNFTTFCFFNVFLRKVQGHYLKFMGSPRNKNKDTERTCQ